MMSTTSETVRLVSAVTGVVLGGMFITVLALAAIIDTDCIWPWADATYQTFVQDGPGAKAVEYRWTRSGVTVATTIGPVVKLPAAASGPAFPPVMVEARDQWGNWSPPSPPSAPMNKSLRLRPGEPLTANHFITAFAPAYTSGWPICGEVTP